MNTSGQIPSALRVVAYIHLVVGILCVIQSIVLFLYNTVSLQFGLLGIPIFFGLLSLRNGWRVCAMVLQWFGLIGLPIFFLLGLSGAVPTYFQFFGLRGALVPGWFVSAGTIPLFFLALWQYRVLIRPDVRQLFLEVRPGVAD
ncbi:MAG: hypothetical protein HZB26_05895 [Candidatus Hydrogenedentes bacterium]|nr:hypothetical protein [Candidatus Hydrogenedentota bacterium]